MKRRLLVTGVLLLALFLAACGANAGTATPRATRLPAASSATASLPAPSRTPAASLVANLSELEGGVQAKRPADADFLAATPGLVLPTLSQVRTQADGHARLDLSSGTIIRITPNSLFTLTVKDPDPVNPLLNLKLLTGQLFIILSGGSVNVETPAGVAAVLGSYMSVRIDPKTGDILVQCLEGSCKLDTPAGSFDLHTGQKARLPFTEEGAEPVDPQIEDMTEEDIQDWMDTNPEAGDVLDDVATQEACAADDSCPTEEDPCSTDESCSPTEDPCITDESCPPTDELSPTEDPCSTDESCTPTDEPVIDNSSSAPPVGSSSSAPPADPPTDVPPAF